MIAEIEAALVERVREIVDPLGIQAAAHPDGAASHAHTHPKGTVLVVNNGGSYAAPEKTGSAVQMRTLTFALTLLVRNLRSHDGVYQVIDALAQGLAGWRPRHTNGTNGGGGGYLSLYGARLERDGFVSQDAGVWVWNVQVAVPGVVLAPRTPKETAAPLARATVNVNGGPEQVVMGGA